jgi:rubrerythrin
MPDVLPFKDKNQLYQWYYGIKMANRNNIFCHCRNCNYEWVDSSSDAVCRQCGSQNIENISCWQFPDD